MLKEFQEFVARGNVMDLAVGVIIGGAFGLIVTSLVDDIIMPIVGAIFGGLDFSNYFVALAPDLYHGESTDHPDDAGRMMMALNIERTEKDLRGAIEALAARDETRGTKVGTVGFCMGGQLSLYAACKNPAVGACVDYYGIHPAVSLDFVGLEAPVLGFFGETDAFVTPEAAQQLEADLVAADKRVEIHVYPAGHAFFNDSRPDAYDEHFAEESWVRMIAFYREHLD